MGGRHIPAPVVLALAVAALGLMYCQKACAHQAGEPSDNELAAERLRVAKAYLDCKARHGALADRVR